MFIMNRKENESEQREKAYNNLNRISEEAEKCMKELESRTSYLPIVEQDGSSECPFAEDLYAQKEEAEDKFRDLLSDLNGQIPLLTDDIVRHRRNLKQISSDKEKLTTPQPKGSYSSAEQQLQSDLHRALRIQSRVGDILKRAKLALEIAESKKFPGRKPQRKGFSPGASAPASPIPLREPVAVMPPPVMFPGGVLPAGPVVSSPGPALGGPTGGLLSSGPLK